MKPKLFIGSSSQALPLVEHVIKAMSSVAHCIPWDKAPQFSTKGSITTIAALYEAANEYDFALFLLTPDDTITDSKKRKKKAPRDNVVFELGLFLSAIGPERVLAILQGDSEVKVPSDLEGVNMPLFVVSADPAETFADINKSTAGFRETISKLRFRKIVLQVANSWTFNQSDRQFEVVLGASKLVESRLVIGDWKIAVAARIGDQFTNFDDSPLALSDSRPLASSISSDMAFKIEEDRFSKKVEPQDKIEARIVLIPPGTELEQGCTMKEAIELRCRFVESISLRLGANSSSG